jgi:glutathione reductase (NADPH)
VRSIKDEARRFEAAGIELVLEGRARFADANTLVLDSGRRVRGDSVIICVGGHSRRLPIPGAELAIVPEQVLDLPALPARVAIIGAGNTGAQLVTVFNAFGSQVTLLDVAPRILMASDASIGEAVAAAFTEQGVAVHTGLTGVSGLATTAEGIELTWNEDVTETFDAVIMATGWPADVDDLGLENAGITPERSAIPVDQYFRTAIPHIFAVGDANGRDMLVQAAVFEGEAAAENAVLDANRRTPHHLLPAGGFTDPDYAGVGLTQAQARERDDRCIVATVPYTQLDRAVIDDRKRGFLTLITDRRRELILGAHAVGENAIEVVQSVTTAMAAGIDVSTLAGVKFAYPTYSAVIGMAARALLAEASD